MLPPMSEVSLHEIAQRHGASLLLRFGSTLRGGTHPRSDMDVGGPFGNGVPGFELQVSGDGATDSKKIQLAKGKHVFYCTIPGHREAGMEGTLTTT